LIIFTSSNHLRKAGALPWFHTSLKNVTSCAIHGTQTAVIMAADAKIVECVRSIEAVLIVRHVTFPASLRPLPLSCDIVMAILASIPVTLGRGMLFVIKKDLPCLVFEHDPDGLIRRSERQSRISEHADQQEGDGKAVGYPKLVFLFHLFSLL
jgi:hypothetical protein